MRNIYLFTYFFYFYLFIHSHFPFLLMKPELEENQFLYAVKMSTPNK